MNNPSDTRSFRQRWTDFWFAPSDPTTLGFIRIITGLLIIYIHLAYSVDLQGFFGKHGWYGASYVERERHEFPWTVTSLTDWKEDEPQPRMPEFPHRRQAMMKFIRSLPAKSTDRARAVRFLDRVAQDSSNTTANTAMTMLGRLVELPSRSERADLLVGLEKGIQFDRVAQGGVISYKLVSGGQPANNPLFPEQFLNLKEPERVELAGEIRAILEQMPKDLTESGYIIAHFLELGPALRYPDGTARGGRLALVRFLTSLPDDEAERERLTEYVDYWNHDARRVYRHGHSTVSVWYHVTDPTQMACLHALAIVIMVLFTIGLFTRVTSVLTWIAVLGYIHRTNQILFGMDTMMNILLVYLMIGNSGAALSVDRLIARYRAARQSLQRSGTIDAPTRSFLAEAPASSGANLGIRLIQVHFCFIYMAAGLSKLKGGAWWNGFAFWDVMVNPEFTLLRYPWFEYFMRELASIKPVYYTIIAFGVWFTWGLEICFPFLIWTKLRPVMLWLAVILHAGIGVFMGLNLFELLMLTMLLVYLPPGVIRKQFRGGLQSTKLILEIEVSAPRQARAAALITALDIDRQTQLIAGSTAEPILTASDGTTSSGSKAVGLLFTNLRLLRFFRYLLLVPLLASLFSRWLFPSTTSKVSLPTISSGPRRPAAAS